MTNDLVALIEFYEKEKSIEREKVVEALENAFLSAYRGMVPGAEDIEELRAEVWGALPGHGIETFEEFFAQLA